MYMTFIYILGLVTVMAMPHGASSRGFQNEAGVAAAIVGSSDRQISVVLVYHAASYVNLEYKYYIGQGEIAYRIQ